METKERLQALRTRATRASEAFMAVVQSVGVCRHVEAGSIPIHDKVKII